ncbi:hypothetical protein HYX10_00345 [Candidatus Woesearchaeota archaeon]|nr:hypothetical protein [Candidatus Woesearchaeota archaeon]
MAKIMFSNISGSYLFSESYELLTKTMFRDAIAANSKLENNEWLDEEKKLINSSDKILFLGFKREKPGNVTLTNDIKKLEAIGKKMQQDARKAIIAVAKQKVRNAVTEDELIIQAASSVQELDKSTAMLTKRLREWYGLQNPEDAFTISDSERFIEAVKEGKKGEMGVQLGEDDKREMNELANSATQLLQLRKHHEQYLGKRMESVCPNLLAVAGAAVGAKILAAAGSLRRLATMPATTLQLLGAEKSMFKYLRKKSKKMPRFGILHEHKLIAAAKEKEKGKMARLLADKIAIAARVDYFKGKFVGDKLLREIEEKSK